MSTHSLDGREWAKLSDLETGDILIPDGDFTCITEGNPVVVLDGTPFIEKALNWWFEREPKRSQLYVECAEGRHYLEGQINLSGDGEDHDHLIGLWKAT